MSTMTEPTNAAIIAANLHALRQRLRRGLTVTTAAINAASDNKPTLAIGTCLDLETLLAECASLYRTIMLLHRSNGGVEQNEVHA
jgi:hypothetical protein